MQLRGCCVHKRHLMILFERNLDALHDVFDLHTNTLSFSHRVLV